MRAGFFVGMVCGALLVVAGIVPAASGDGPGGAADLVLPGGTAGSVPFPHKRHQEALVDCAVCHVLFAQKKGAISNAIEEGRLKSKQVMNTHCTQCHRKMKQEGRNTGPVTCKQCHVKP